MYKYKCDNCKREKDKPIKCVSVFCVCGYYMIELKGGLKKPNEKEKRHFKRSGRG